MTTIGKTAISMILAAGVPLAGCGVKGPPLPPVADTPEASDRSAVSGVPPAPKPSPSPSPKAKSKSKAGR